MHRRTRRALSVAAKGLAITLVLARGEAAKAADVAVDLQATKQVIRGFGASSAWCGTVSTSIMDSLYKDLGYTILRVRIEEGIGDAWSTGSYSAWAPELANAKNAIARGAIVFASPWNPPASMKSGGKLITSKYSDYASYLKTYAKYFADNGAPLYAISIQNEPDYAASWTAWTATDLLSFLKDQGAGLSSAIKIMMPESFQFIHAMSDPSLNDATVASYISVIGGHLYGGKIQDYPLARNQGKELWETEHYFDDDQMSNIMSLGKEIHDCMVTGSMNAYVYWWITYGNGLATSSGTVYKRAYVIGQFAKYIRPGYHRVDATANPATNVNVSAYRGDDKVVIVAVNTGSASVNQSFLVSGGTVSQISSWQTTSGSNMAAGQTYQPSGGAFTAALSAQSITTFVGTLSGVIGSPDAGTPDAGATGSGGTGGGGRTGTSRGSGGTGAGGSMAGPGGRGGSDAGSTAAAGSGGTGAGGYVVGSGGRSGAGGRPGLGGATVAGTGGNPGSGGHGDSSASGTGGASGMPGGAGGADRGGGGSPTGGATSSRDLPSGCSCAMGRGRVETDAHSLVGCIMAFLGLAALLGRRRAQRQPRK